MRKNLFFILAALSATLFISACETAEDDAIERARSCVNNASKLVSTNNTAAQSLAAECEAMVRNLTSKESGKIGFGAIMIIEDKFTQIPSMATALQNNGSNALGTGMSFLAFAAPYDTSTNFTRFQTYATRSESAGILKIANMAKIANVAARLQGTATPTGAQVETQIAGLTPANANTPGTDEYTVVTALVSMQQSTCSGSGANTSLCTQLTSAMGSGTTNSAILTSLQTYMAAN